MTAVNIDVVGDNYTPFMLDSKDNIVIMIIKYLRVCFSTTATSMFRKTARIDVSIEESKDVRECRDTHSIFTVNVKLISGEFFYIFFK